MSNARQRGVTTVEFAIVGLLLFVLIFGIIELSRTIFTHNMLQEGVRRAARIAAVCPVGDPAVADAAVFMPLPGLSTANVVVEYLDANGAPVGDPGGAGYGLIRYVRVRIVDYAFRISLPLFPPVIQAPGFTSTLPRESLGVPRYGAGPVAC
jgi:hypothetical protein